MGTTALWDERPPPPPPGGGGVGVGGVAGGGKKLGVALGNCLLQLSAPTVCSNCLL